MTPDRAAVIARLIAAEDAAWQAVIITGREASIEAGDRAIEAGDRAIEAGDRAIDAWTAASKARKQECKR